MPGNGLGELGSVLPSGERNRRGDSGDAGVVVGLPRGSRRCTSLPPGGAAGAWSCCCGMGGTRSCGIRLALGAAPRSSSCLVGVIPSGGVPSLQDGKRAIDLALEQGHGLCVQLLRDWSLPDPQGPRRSLSFLSEDCTAVELLNSTPVTQLEEPGLGDSCGLGEPPCCAQPSLGSSLTPWLPGCPALPLQPLASSTLLWAGGEHEEVSLKGAGVCSSLQPSAGARSPPQPLHCSRDCGVLEAGTRGRDLPGDSSEDSEHFVTAVEMLEPSGAGVRPGEAPSSAGPWELPAQNPSAAEELPVLFQGCSLEGSSPRTRELPCSPAGIAVGDVTSQGLQPPQFCHVTPRTKSRLQASAVRLNASSSSSSLFDASLEKPRRPPRIRAPRGVLRDPAITPGHCVALGGDDVSGGDGESPGSSDDTQILPRTPSLSSSPLGTSSSSPTVLLAPGDHGCAQNPLLDAEGSLSPTVLLGPGDSDNLQDSPSHVQNSTPAIDPKVPEPKIPPMPRSPTDRSPHRPVEPDGCPPTGWRSPSAETTSPGDGDQVQSLRMLSDEALLRRLRELGYDPGPITVLTRRVYLRRLEELSRSPAGHSPELTDALRTGHIPNCTEDELMLAQQFDRPDRSRHWREGLLKASFNYLLLDPRTTQELPLRCHRLSPVECFRTFVDAIFYVGKGTRARPYSHLAEAVTQHRMGTRKGCPKVRRILEIWASGMGVISLHCFQSSVPAEAYTREGCLLEALGLRAVTNQRKGNCYGVAASWSPARRRRLGVHMLHRAMRIFLAEGERQLRPADIQAGH
ncbi:ankyrin repeat and LEM domain-containing protein 1 isoform X2 [Phasianus colchicus]|uniref:Ankyrin repeat and LEM domain containing 1 n=1 Tax=Phasianus colchicus TaxID=9054 RepID=A0A669Q5U9_PHACC|nr:ankyrin repeat and LEM domain-containing protein 1 isoform X2 [Phasianus colchicus]